MVKSWFVYLISCCDGSFYTGTTNDLDKRMKMHLSGKGSKYVARRGFQRLLASRECKDRSDACKQEYLIKKLPKWDKMAWFRD